MARHKIVPRRKKNSKSESLEQRIGLIQRFHHTLATKLLPTTPTFIAQEQYQQGETEVALTIFDRMRPAMQQQASHTYRILGVEIHA